MKRICIALAFAAFGLTAGASAQEFPTKPIRMVVPFPPGGGVDVLARQVVSKMGFKQPVVVEHRPGAGGNLGAAEVAKSAPDGYTILLTTIGVSASPSLYRKLHYDAARDLAAVTQVVSSRTVLVATPKFAANNVQELVAIAKSKPGALNYGSSGIGAPLHLAMEIFKHSAGVDILHVPYRGDAPLRTALAAGDVQVGFVPINTALPMIAANQVKPLAINGAKRSHALPDVPTIAESGVSGLEWLSWQGVFAPAKTPPEIVRRIQQEIAKALKHPEIEKAISIQGNDTVGNSPEEFDAQFRADLERFAKVVKEAKIPRLD